MRITKFVLTAIVIIAFVATGVFLFSSNTEEKKQETATSDHKNTEYLIEGQLVRLKDGVAETEIAPNSQTKTITRYFGNDFRTDLNGDGNDDHAFLLTQERGGSGTFFYVVAALNMNGRLIGSDGYLLGDRIAPQNINISQNPRHRNVIVVNFADRKKDEPMTSKPSIGKSVYLKIDPMTTRWGIVEPNFEGESR